MGCSSSDSSLLQFSCLAWSWGKANLAHRGWERASFYSQALSSRFDSCLPSEIEKRWNGPLSSSRTVHGWQRCFLLWFFVVVVQEERSIKSFLLHCLILTNRVCLTKSGVPSTSAPPHLGINKKENLRLLRLEQSTWCISNFSLILRLSETVCLHVPKLSELSKSRC